jgi:hypothetical protein
VNLDFSRYADQHDRPLRILVRRSLPETMPSMLKPRQLPSLLFALAGAASLALGATRWFTLPKYTDQDLETATELNLSLDLARLGEAHQPPPERLPAMREAVRGEVLATVSAPREAARSYMLAGAGLLVVALGRTLFLRRLAARGEAA